jgi:GNAT superfamily N-acetyltransferase
MIREATADDRERIVEMGMSFAVVSEYNETVAAKPGVIGETIDRMLASPDGVILVAEIEGVVMGMIGMVAYEHPYSGDRTAQEMFWWVDPSTRGSSIGIKLLRAAEVWAKERGAKAMQMVAPNASVASLYSRLGYRRLETAYQRSI